MSYQYLKYIQLGESFANLTLSATLVNTSGHNVTGHTDITVGFTEIGSGNYLWNYSNYPNEFRGAVKIYNNDTGEFLVAGAINPQDVEYLDTYVSSIPNVVSSGISGNTGAYIVNVYTEDQDSNAIGDAQVQVHVSGGVMVGLLTTNTTTGRATFNLGSGSYQIYAYKNHIINWPNPFNYHIQDNADITLTGYTWTIPSIESGNLVRVYTYVNDLGLNNQKDIEMIIKPSGTTEYNNSVLTTKGSSALSDSDGYVYIDIAPNTAFRLEIPKAGVDTYFVSPASGVLNVVDI